jgi:hypothetical protein
VPIDGSDRRFSLGKGFSHDGGIMDHVGNPEVISAISGAVSVLADTLNALGLRIALARNDAGRGTEVSPEYYNRLACLAESAAGQVRGIQQLIATIDGFDGTMPRNRSRS